MAHPELHRTHNIGWLRAAVLGANDGLISTSSLVVGVAAAQTARGPILLQLSTRKPVRTVVTVDRKPVQTQRVTSPTVVRVGSSGWHLVGIDAASAANGLRVLVRSAR